MTYSKEYDAQAREEAFARAIRITNLVNPLLGGQSPAMGQEPRPDGAVWGEPYFYLDRRCHRIVFEALQPFIPLKIDRLMDVTEGLGAGYSGMGEMCGAVTGAIMAAGLDLCSRYDDQNLIRLLVSKHVALLLDKIRGELGSPHCRDITGMDMSDWMEKGPESGWARFVHDESALKKCGRCIESCIKFPLPGEQNDYLDSLGGRG